MNIAIFGGSFDPPHIGHDNVVRAARLNLDAQIIVVPTFLSPFKAEFSAPPQLRLKWCEILWSNSAHVSPYEIEQNRAVPTIQTALHFKQIYSPERIFLIIGADQLANLRDWHEFTQLEKLVEFVVAARDGVEIPPNLQKLEINAKISSSKIRQSLDFSQIPPAICAQVKKFYEDLYAKNRKN